jgi:hypothetical protein
MQDLYLSTTLWSTKKGQRSKASQFSASTRLAKTLIASHNSLNVQKNISQNVFFEPRKSDLCPPFSDAAPSRYWHQMLIFVVSTLPTADSADSLAVLVYIMVIFSKPWEGVVKVIREKYDERGGG